MQKHREELGKVKSDEVLVLLRGSGQPLAFVMMAVQIAASPDEVHAFLRWAVFGDTPAKPQPPRPPTIQWLAMYRDHRGMQDGIAARMGMGEGEVATGSEFLDELRAPRSSTSACCQPRASHESQPKR
jgi:hypothetical protein